MTHPTATAPLAEPTSAPAPTRLRLGCIADDLTGATDLANMLARAGCAVVQTIGVPGGPPPEGVDAVVVALKSRSIEPALAVRQSLQALDWLRAADAAQVYFKICSTFDSTDRGNIGPVAEALLEALGSPFTIACPAFPANGRTVYQGHLFTGSTLLNEGPMRHHPLNPMTDANLVRVLQRQTRRPVGLIAHESVRRGAAAIAERMQGLKRDGVGIAIVDAIDDADLLALGRACADLPLVVAGSGLALGLPQNWPARPVDPTALAPARGARAVIAGSCSAATQAQVAHFAERHPGRAWRLQPLRLAEGVDVVAEALEWALPRLGSAPLLVYATAPADEVAAAQARLGAREAGVAVEQALGRIARGLVEHGVRQLVVAGGETSGACVGALGLERLRIGPQIDPGVPWCEADLGDGRLHIALKSGNFGAVDFFTRAFEVLSS